MFSQKLLLFRGDRDVSNKQASKQKYLSYLFFLMLMPLFENTNAQNPDDTQCCVDFCPSPECDDVCECCPPTVKPIVYTGPFSDFSRTAKFNQFMGINLRRSDPIDKAKCVGFVREYHLWDIDEISRCPEFDPNCNYQDDQFLYPNNQYAFEPTEEGSSLINSFDLFYQEIADNGLQVCATLMETSERVSGDTEFGRDEPPSYRIDGNDYCGASPIADNSTDPASYEWRGDYITQFVNRYGGDSNPINFLTPDMDKNRVIAAVNSSGQVSDFTVNPADSETRGLVQYVENWNEQDKWWLINGCFNVDEYCTMSSIDYDGIYEDANGNDVQLEAEVSCFSNESYRIGFNHLDSDIRFVMGGLTKLDEEYLMGMQEWFANNRPNWVNNPDNADKNGLPFDVLNFHHYSDGGYATLNYGISPERDNLYEQLKRLDEIRDTEFPDKELWLSEFGYNTEPNPENEPFLNNSTTIDLSNAYVPRLDDYTNDQVLASDLYEIQGQWIVRSFLVIAAADFDKAFVYEIKDIYGELIGSWALKCGLLKRPQEGLQPKKSWFYTYSLKNIMGETDFETIPLDQNNVPLLGSLDCNEQKPRIYKFSDGSEDIYAIWSPTSCDIATYDFDLNSVPELAALNLSTAAYYKMEVPSTTGIYEEVVAINGQLNVPVSERPIFLTIGGTPPPVVECVENEDFFNPTCNSVLLTWDIPITQVQPYSHYQIWYGLQSDLDASGTANNPDISINTSMTLFESNLLGTATQATIAGLAPNESYYFYIVPFVGNKDPLLPFVACNSTGWCDPIPFTSPNDGGACNIPIDLSMLSVTDASGNTTTANNALRMFDGTLSGTNGAYEDGIDCCFLPEGIQDDDVNANTWQSNGEEVIIDFGAPYIIDVIYLYDGNGVSTVTIEYEDLAGFWQPFVNNYVGSMTGIWKAFANEITQCQEIQRLKIYTSLPSGAIGEIVICGKPTTFYESPDATFTVTNQCGIYSFSSNSSSDLNHFWNFGDLSTDTDVSSLENPTYVYTSSGIYSVTHTVKNICNESTSIQDVMVLDPGYDAGFEFEITPCETEVSFESNQTGNNLSHIWSFINLDTGNSGSFSTNENPIFDFQTFGTFEIIHNIIDNDCDENYSDEEIIMIEECAPEGCDCPEDAVVVGSPNIETKLSEVIAQNIWPGPSGNNGVSTIIRGTLLMDVENVNGNINGNYFIAGDICMAPGAKIIVPDDAQIDFMSNHTRGCNERWDGIVVESGGQLAFNQDARMEDAQRLAQVKAGGMLQSRAANFDRNYITWSFENPNGFSSLFSDLTNNFTCSSPLLQHFDENDPEDGDFSYAGIEIIGQNGILSLNPSNPFSDNTSMNFTNLRNGIISENCELTVRNCHFNNILRGEYPISGNGIFATGEGQILNISEEEPVSTFNTCFTGIRTQGMSTNIQYVEMNDIRAAGIFIEDAAATLQQIEFNNIHSYTTGIWLNNTDGAAGILLNANFLEIENTPTPLFPIGMGYGIRVTENATPHINATITSNTCDIIDGFAGINLHSSFGFDVTCNRIDLNQLTEPYSGILIQESTPLLVDYNSIDGDYQSSNINNNLDDFGSTGIRAIMAENVNYNCNSVENTPIGVQFGADCIGTSLQNNSFQNHQWGLHYPEMGETGPQPISNLPAHRNRWYGDWTIPGVFGARHESGDPDVVQNSIYTVPNISTAHPETISSNVTGWFQVEQNKAEVISCFLEPIACPQLAITIDDPVGELPPGPSTPVIGEIERRIAKGDYIPEGYDVPLTWLAERYLYEKLDKYPTLMLDDTDYQTFYLSKSNTTIAQFTEVRKAINEMYKLEEATILELKHLYRQKMVELEEIRKLDSALVVVENETDSLQLINERQLHLTLLNSHSLTNQLLYQTLHNGRVLQADLILAQNNSINATEIFEQNEKTVNRIFLNTLAKGISAINDNQLNELIAVAEQCIYTGGRAVLRARSMLASRSDLVFTDACANTSQQSISNPNINNDVVQSASFKVFPNPAKDEITIKFEHNLSELPTALSIHNLSGQEVIRKGISPEMNAQTFSVEGLTNGIYYLKILDKTNHSIHLEKLVIIQ